MLKEYRNTCDVIFTKNNTIQKEQHGISNLQNN